jgi:hypothetical protein
MPRPEVPVRQPAAQVRLLHRFWCRLQLPGERPQQAGLCLSLDPGPLGASRGEHSRTVAGPYQAHRRWLRRWVQAKGWW